METEKTPQEIVEDCNKEIAEVLKKHNCILDVDVKKSSALGKHVMVLDPVIIYKGENK